MLGHIYIISFCNFDISYYSIANVDDALALVTEYNVNQTTDSGLTLLHLCCITPGEYDIKLCGNTACPNKHCAWSKC